MFSGKFAKQVDSVTQSSQTSSTNTAAAALTRDPHRLQALCELWRGTERDLWLTLKGTSMMASIRPGSRLRLRCDLIDPKLGDVIAFRRGNLLIVHRLKHFDAQGNLICQGDANSFLDAPAALQDVVGVVVEVCPPGAWMQTRQNIGHVMLMLRRSAGRGQRFLVRTLKRGRHT